MRHNGGRHMYCFMTDEGYLCSLRGSRTKFFLTRVKIITIYEYSYTEKVQ